MSIALSHGRGHLAHKVSYAANQELTAMEYDRENLEIPTQASLC
jgi:predicted RNA methylase